MSRILCSERVNMQFGTKRLKFLYFAIKLAVIAVIGAAMSYCAHLVFWRMLGGQASIGVMSAFVGGVCGAVLLAAAVFVGLIAKQFNRFMVPFADRLFRPFAAKREN